MLLYVVTHTVMPVLAFIVSQGTLPVVEPACSEAKWAPTLLFEPPTSLNLTDDTPIKVQYSAGTQFYDFDHDGRIDLMLATEGRIYVYRGTEGGKFLPPKPVTYNGGIIDTGRRKQHHNTIVNADIDGDQKPDLLHMDRRKLYYYKQTGLKEGVPTFGDPVFVRSLDDIRIDVADWNNDGTNDVIVGAFYGQLRVYMNHIISGRPVLSDYIELREPKPGAYVPWPRVLDLNGDGTLEILYSMNWGNFGVYVKDTKHSYKRFDLRLTNMKPINVRRQYREHQKPEVVDVDGDGIMDLVTSGQSGHVVFFRGVDGTKDRKHIILRAMAAHPYDLGQKMENSTEMYNLMYDSHRYLQEYMLNPLYLASVKERLRVWYLALVTEYPKYFARQKFQVPGLARFAGYIWTIILEALPDTPRYRRLLSTVARFEGYAAKILVDRGILIINNNGAPERKMKLIYDFLMLKNPDLFALAYITQKGYLKGKSNKYGSIVKGSVNIFTGADWGENSFPRDCKVCKEKGRNPVIMTFMAALVHEVAHNELDVSRSPSYNETLFKRKYEILKRATEGHVVYRTPARRGVDWDQTKKLFIRNGWWDGLANWDNVFKAHFRSGGAGVDVNKNSIRPVHIDYFVRAPQESFATLANEYFADTKLMLDFALERTKAGYPVNMDWFILIVDFYTRGGNDFPLFVIDRHGNMKKDQAVVKRNAEGYIHGFLFDRSLPGPSDYTCVVDDQGFVQTCDAN